MTVHEETIAVRDGPAVTLRVRETELGPVATEFCFALPDEGEAVLRRIPMCETDRETVQAALAMMRAKDAESFHAALDGWRFPSLNMVYGDRRGQIGYRTLAAIPLRARNDRAAGNFATSYRGADEGWREMVPMTLLPQVKQPKSGYLYTANHKPVESWYPIPLGISTGAGGDTIRSWRLRELLEATGREAITPAMVRAMHFDRVNPARRALVAIAIKLREQHEQDLSLGALFAIDMLERWWKQGALSALDQEGAALAQQLNTFFRVMNTPLAGQYGGGESGLVYYLKTRAAEISSGKRLSFSKDEIAYIDAVFAGAWETASSQYGSDPGQWGALAKEILRTRQLGYLEGLDGFPSVDRTMDLDMPVLQDIDGGTIGCQTAQSYTQYVPMHDPDQAESLLPIGASEVREHPGRLATWDLWSAGQLHPAPLSRSAIQPHCVGTKRILTR